VFLLPPVFFFSYAGSTLGQWVVEGSTPRLVLNTILLSLGITMITVAVLLLRHSGLRLSGTRNSVPQAD
jgi:hypothetical protein